jgi:glutamate carboxypeptidase
MKNVVPQKLEWIDRKLPEMVATLTEWSSINSGSDHLEGLNRMSAAIFPKLEALDGAVRHIHLPPTTRLNQDGQAVSIQHGSALYAFKRPDAPIKVLLGGHFDTVYSAHSLFQRVEQIDPDTLRGPGVTDMKGGLVVLLTALSVFEQTPAAEKIGWEIFINPDEETGSEASDPIWRLLAKRNDLGLLFEPSFSDGSLVSTRKGTSNYTVIARGLAAHAGRDFHQGRNAISALAKLIQKIEELQSAYRTLTINTGFIHGGGPVNIVPDFALCRLNLRAETFDEMRNAHDQIEHLIHTFHVDGITWELQQETFRPPKEMNGASQKIFDHVKVCARELGFDLSWRPSGGGSDGNNLSAEGLPVIDTLGVIGGNIHTPHEYIQLSSLAERAKLTFLFLHHLATGVLKIPSRAQRTYGDDILRQR